MAVTLCFSVCAVLNTSIDGLRAAQVYFYFPNTLQMQNTDHYDGSIHPRWSLVSHYICITLYILLMDVFAIIQPSQSNFISATAKKDVILFQADVALAVLTTAVIMVYSNYKHIYYIERGVYKILMD